MFKKLVARVISRTLPAVTVLLVALPLMAVTPQERCGTRLPAPDELADIQKGIDAEDGSMGTETITVPVFFHVINAGKGIRNGDLPQSLIDAQIEVLNQSFGGLSGGAPSPFSFVLAGVTRTTNENWFANFAWDWRVEYEAKTTLRRGGSESLNIYSANGQNATAGFVILGFAYYPKWATKQRALVWDGVMVDWRTVPGVAVWPYNLGDTATHEVGHWLGLLHTFDGGCSLQNDHVKDTPAEAGPNFYCLAGIDTCTGNRFEGLDPITNFMDYSDDSCMYEFTEGQVERMARAWKAFRR